jgi:hypothetical protein
MNLFYVAPFNTTEKPKKKVPKTSSPKDPKQVSRKK